MVTKILTEKEQMGKEFNLSEYITTSKEGCKIIFVTRIKEFIKLDFDIIRDFMTGEITWKELIIRRDKLIGEKLICQK